MSRVRFTKAEPKRLPLSDGDWIEVRSDLNTGESKMLEAAGNGAPIRLADNSVYTPIDWSVYEMERVAIFLLDWSLKGHDDKVVPLFTKEGVFIMDSLRALDPPDFQEINNAITTWILERAKEKNVERGNRGSKQPDSPETDLTLS